MLTRVVSLASRGRGGRRRSSCWCRRPAAPPRTGRRRSARWPRSTAGRCRPFPACRPRVTLTRVVVLAIEVAEEDVAGLVGVGRLAEHRRLLEVRGRRLEGHELAVAADDGPGALAVGLDVGGADVDPERRVGLAVVEEAVGRLVGVVVDEVLGGRPEGHEAALGRQRGALAVAVGLLPARALADALQGPVGAVVDEDVPHPVRVAGHQAGGVGVEGDVAAVGADPGPEAEARRPSSPSSPEVEPSDVVMLVVDAPPRGAPTSGAARAADSRRAPAARPRAREPPGRPRPGVRSFPSVLLVPLSDRSERLSSRLPSRARSVGRSRGGSVTKGALVNS